MAIYNGRGMCEACGLEFACYVNEFGRFIRSHRPPSDTPWIRDIEKGYRWCAGSGCKPCDCGKCERLTIQEASK